MKYILYAFLLILPFSSHGQTLVLIDSLEQFIFPNNELQPDTILEKFIGWGGDTVIIEGRRNQPSPNELRKMEGWLKQIRLSKDNAYLSPLLEIQKRQEQQFLIEWEPSYQIGHRMYDWHYEILMNLEMTLQSLYIDNYLSEQERYPYVKNIYMLQWGDNDPNRKERINFFSEYIKEKWDGACLRTQFCSPLLLIEKGDDLAEGILEDIRSITLEKLEPYEKNYYLITLGKAAIQIKSDEVEDVYIQKMDFFDGLHPLTLKRQIWVYHVLGARARRKGLSFLINDLDGRELLELPDLIISRDIAGTSLGKELLKERLMNEIRQHKGENQKEYLSLLLTHTLDTDSKNNIENLERLKKILSEDNLQLLTPDSKFR